MGYQVLARKWRPNRFGELVGQEHVVTAISNALDNDRLHHAYLFTGTRGVGKTTIARIFSKSLNCETGLSSKPCGQCSTCKEIENGNFIDLLEIDAASRTKVEDTRELLDNVQYKPSRGRYKVYLIDEVHMLSKHSFNALLKTLEEPPPHVKFLLATTDPQKLPVTILSRCLQFNLKALSRTQISQQLDFILGEENIQFEKEALSQLARAAQGSMRDALSLTDQAIAQGNGIVGLKIVTDMLGLMDKNQVLKLVHAVIQKESQKVLQQVELMSQQAADFGLVLSEVMSLMHQIALTQFVPDACKLETISARAIFQLANSISAEQIQLLYQIALKGKKDLPHAADPRTGFEMTLLRMLAFCPNNLKLDALEIAAATPDVAVVAQQFTNQAATPDTQTTLAAEPVTNVPNDPLNQNAASNAVTNAATNAETKDVSKLENSNVEVKPENSLPIQEKVNIEPEPQQLAQTIENHTASSENDVSAQLPEMKAPQQDLKAPQQDLKAPQQDLKAPQQDLKAPQQDLKAPQQDLQNLKPPQQNLKSPQQDLSAPPLQDLNAQQQDIMLQAEQYGHQSMNYDHYQSVSMEELSSGSFPGEYETSHHEDATQQQLAPQVAAVQQPSTKPNTSTADLIALRNKLKQSQREEGEGAAQVKKSESSTPFNLASIRKQNQQVDSTSSAENVDTPTQSQATPAIPIAELPVNANSDPITNDAPPWSLKNESQATPEVVPLSSSAPALAPALAPSPFPAEKIIEEAEAFDPSAHLDDENVGDVTLEISAFLPDKQKVLKAWQVDGWSQLIEDMQVTALTKQLALHSGFEQQGNTVKLTLLEAKSHLISETAQQQLKEALCLALNNPIELEIALGQPINTPYALQLKVNRVRHEYAQQVLKHDAGIQLLQQQFAATLDQQSIQAR